MNLKKLNTITSTHEIFPDSSAKPCRGRVSPYTGKQVFNIGNPQEITIQDLAQKVQELAGSTSRIVHRPLLPDDLQRRCPDISKAKKLLGWTPTVTLDEGLRKTIEWFRQRREATR
jgi:nucleoside-diphosphate-sugar epimerase